VADTLPLPRLRRHAVRARRLVKARK